MMSMLEVCFFSSRVSQLLSIAHLAKCNSGIELSFIFFLTVFIGFKVSLENADVQFLFGDVSVVTI